MRDNWRRGAPWRPIRAGAVVSLLAISGLLGAACGDSDAPGIASIGSTSTTTTTPAAQNGTPASVYAAELAYTKCMRSHGVPNFPDPGASGGFVIAAGSGVDPRSQTFKAAQTACAKDLPGGGPGGPGSGPPPTAEAMAQMLRIAQCMRRHGISKFPDPRSSLPTSRAGIALISDIDGVILVFPSSIDTSSPAFVHAADACGFPLHNH